METYAAPNLLWRLFPFMAVFSMYLYYLISIAYTTLSADRLTESCISNVTEQRCVIKVVM